MSWREPLRLAPFPQHRPVRRPRRAARRHRAAPGAGRARHRSRRQDLGAAHRRHAAGDRRARSGKGWVVLVHTTANADWSTLALSGLFVRDAAAAGRAQPRASPRRQPQQALPPLRNARRLRPAGDAAGHRRGAIAAEGDRARNDQPAPSARLLRPRRHQARAQHVSRHHELTPRSAPARRRHAQTGFAKAARDRSEALAAGRRARAAGGRSA